MLKMCVGDLPDHIRYWINSIPTQECALFDSLECLRRGNVLRDIMMQVTGGQGVPYSSATYSGLVRSTVYYLAEQLSWSQLPVELQAPSAIEALASGEKDVTLALLEFLYHICHPEVDACCTERSMPASHVPPSAAGKPTSTKAAITSSSAAKVSKSAPVSVPLRRPQPSSEPILRTVTSVPTRPSSAQPISSKPIIASSRPSSAPRPTKSTRTASPRRRRSHSLSKSLNTSVSAVTNSAAFARHSACITGKHLSAPLETPCIAAEHYDILSEVSSLSLDEMHHLLDWIQSLDIKFNHVTLTTDLFSNKWCNGVLLSEIAAAVCREHKELVKQVQEKVPGKVYENKKPLLILASTEHNVHSRAQIARNFNTSLEILNTHRGISGLPSAEDLLNNSVSLWEALLAIYRSTRSKPSTPAPKSRRRVSMRSRSKSPELRHSRDKDSRRSRSNSLGALNQPRRENQKSNNINNIPPPTTPANSTDKPLEKPKPATSPKSILKRPITSPNSTTELPEWNDSTVIAAPKKAIATAILRGREDAKTILRKSLENTKKQPREWKLSPSEASPEQPVLQTVTGEQQVAVRDWLRTLGIYIRDGEGGFKNPTLLATVSASVTMLPLHEDRIRNGVLLCLLLQAVEVNACIHTQLAKRMYLHPASLAQATNNVERALWLFRLRKCPPIPLVYLSHPKRILECDKNYTWGLLYEIMQAYDASVAGTPIIAPQPLSLSSANIPYTPKQRQQLDISLMQWLSSLDVLPGLYNAVDEMPSILTLETSLRNGTLLCAVAAKICGKENSKSIRGWNKSPKTLPQFVMNLRKCTAALNRCLTMSQRYLYSGVEEDIARGEWMAILGLLQDMHRFHDRELPPSTTPPGGGTASGYPYLGKPSYWPFDSRAEEKQVPRLRSTTPDIVPSHEMPSRHDENVDVNVIRGPLPSSMRSIVAAGKSDILPDPHRLSGGQIQRHSHDLTPLMRGDASPDAYRGAPKPLSLRVQAATSRTTNAEAVDDDIDVPPPPPPKTPTTVPRRQQQYDDIVSVASTPPSIPLIRTKITTLLHQHHAKDAAAAFKWLTSLHLPFVLPSEVREPGKHDTLPAFADGVIFCKLLQHLERSNPIPGVVLMPKTRAHKLQNIRKVLEMLTRHKHVPLGVLAYEDDLLQGRADAIVDVLLKIKEVYKNRRNWSAVR